jgi:UDP-4-amino-4,6-dideoxy-N-acetyl-beta-L-altrosamine transaminase
MKNREYLSMIPYGRQDINADDIDAVVEILQSDFLTQGPTVSLFEQEVCQYTGAKYGVSVNSATSALHLACLALELGKGDILWTTPITFVASANCGIYCGAKVDFVDIDPKSYNISAEVLEEKLSQAKKEGKLPKVVIPVHLCGQSCEMEKIYMLSKKYCFNIIEDASHAIGGKYKGEFIGNGKYSDITVFSFHPVKIITTGEGGMAVTNNKKLAEKMSLLRSHGITRNPKLMTCRPDGPWNYQQIELGFNYRMTDIQAALGICQMKRLNRYITKRHEIAHKYNEKLKGLSIVTPHQNPNVYSTFHLYVIKLKDEAPVSQKTLLLKLRKREIMVNLHYFPVYRQPFYEKMDFNRNDYSVAENYYQRAISLPIYPMLSSEDQNRVIDSIKEIFQQ